MKPIFTFSVLLLLLANAPAQADEFKIVIGYPRQGPARCQTHEYRHRKGDCHDKKKAVYFEEKSLPYLLWRVFSRQPDYHYYTRSGSGYYPCSQYYCRKHHKYHAYGNKHHKHCKKKCHNDCEKSRYRHPKYGKKKHCNDYGWTNYGQYKKYSYYKW